MREPPFNFSDLAPPGELLPVPKAESPSAYRPSSGPSGAREDGPSRVIVANPHEFPGGAPTAFPGGPRGTDRRPAWLTEGEFVVNATDASLHRGLLETINSLHGAPAPKGMAGGGIVGSPGEPAYLAGGGFLKGLMAKGKKLIRRATDKSDVRGLPRRRRAKILEGRARAKQQVQSYGESAGRATKGGPLSVVGEFADVGAKAATGDVAGALTATMKMFTDRVSGAFDPNNKMNAAGNAAGAAGMMAFGVPGVGPFGMLGEVVLKTADHLKEFSNQLHESNKQFAQWSGSMAGVMARQEARDILFSQQKGEARAGSAEYLATGKSQLEKATMPIENTMAKAQNLLTGVLDRAMAKFLEMGGWVYLFKAAEKVLDLLTPNVKGGGGLEVLELGAKAYDAKYGRPRHLPGGGE